MQGVIFPSTIGTVVSKIREGLAESGSEYAPGVKVQPKLPPQPQRVQRMITVRDDSGPDDGTQTRRRYGINVWAESPVAAEQLALLTMAVCRNMADGQPITLVDQVSGPIEIDETTPLLAGTVLLFHYYFTFRLTARGANF